MASEENSPMTMYNVKPFYDFDAKMDVPDCMYKVKPYHSATAADGHGQAMDPEMLELEQRQDGIMKRLAELQLQVADLVGTSKSSSTSMKSTASTYPHAQPAGKLPKALSSGLQDIVISVNPANPPLSLFVMTELLRAQYSVLSTSHIHSSVRGVSEKLRNASLQNGVVIARHEYQVIITVIWKDVKTPVLMVSPQKHTPLMGEANVARYLARLLSPAYDEGDIVKATEIDDWVDSLPQLLHGSSAEKTNVIKALNSRLGKNSWLVGEAMSLADVAMWSAMHQSGRAAKASGNVKKWLDCCNEHAAFQKTLKLVS